MQDQRNRCRAALHGILVLAVLGLTVVASWHLFAAYLESNRHLLLPDADGSRARTISGITSPAIHRADEVSLPDDIEVIGVEINGTHRAYCLSALRPVSSHIVNDMIDDSAVSVTFCDRTDCVRVFADATSRRPLPLSVAGFEEGAMMIHADGQRFSQDSLPDLPYALVPFERTEWKHWRDAHPETEVYLGHLVAMPGVFVETN